MVRMLGVGFVPLATCRDYTVQNDTDGAGAVRGLLQDIGTQIGAVAGFECYLPTLAKLQLAVGSSQPSGRTRAAVGHDIEAEITSIYRRYNPAKVADVPRLMEKYRGRSVSLRGDGAGGGCCGLLPC